MKWSLSAAKLLSIWLLLCSLTLVAAEAMGQTPSVSAEWHVYLQSRTIEPQPGIDVELGDSAEPQIVLLQLANKTVTPTERQQLAEQGITLLQYIPHNTWIAQIAPTFERAALDNMRWIGALNPADKLAPYGAQTPEQELLDVRVLLWSRDEIDIILTLGEITADISPTIIDMHLVSEEALAQLAALTTVRWVEPMPAFSQLNHEVRLYTGAEAAQAPPYNLSGEGVKIGLFDFGKIDNHADLTGRVTNHPYFDQYGYTVSEHATHIAGTLIGDGQLDSDMRGVAPGATLNAYVFWTDVYRPGSIDYTDELDISSNSWGVQSCNSIGQYTIDSLRFDTDPTIPVIFAAGNTQQACPDQSEDGYGTVLGYMQSSKNVLTVGAVDDALDLAGFSAMGPVLDGRVKPEIMAPGVNVTSTCLGDAYCTYNGTSMAAPAVASGMALLVEHYRNVTPLAAPDMLPSTLRALLIHTATDIGTPGPDFATGYGLIDIPAALDNVAYAIESTVENGTTNVHPVHVAPDSATFAVTLVWNDVPGDPAAAYQLVNNLDLDVIAPDGTLYQPYVLNPAAPDQPAVPGVDALNVVEKVVVTDPVPGTWTVRVHGTNVPVGPQAYSLAGDLEPPEPTALGTLDLSLQAGSSSILWLLIPLIATAAVLLQAGERRWL